MTPHPHVGEMVRFAAPGGDEGEVVHVACRAFVARRRRGAPVLFVVVAMNGWRLDVRLAPWDLDTAIGLAVGYSAGRRCA